MPSNALPDPIQLLRQLVRLPSVSSTDPKRDQGNRAVVDLLADILATLGFSVRIQTLNDSGTKANLIAGKGTGPGGLVLAGHTDTVPYDEALWSCEPLGITERDQKLYGLGATDMKGFFPLVIESVKALADTPLQQPLIVLATADEESSMNGARALSQAGLPKARQAIIGEPTGLRPVRLHKGILMEAVHIQGSSGHSSDPSLGNSALEGLHAVIGSLLDYRGELQRRFSHALFDVQYPTLNLGCVRGGDNPNRICGQTELHFDLRMTPGFDNDSLRGEIARRLTEIADRRQLKISLRSLMGGVEPFEQRADSHIVQLAEKLTGHRAEAAAFATEAPFLQRLGMDTIVLGPGSIKRAHQPDEFIELDQLQPCIELLGQFIGHFCVNKL